MDDDVDGLPSKTDINDTRTRKRNYSAKEINVLVNEVKRFKDFLLTHKFVNQGNDKKDMIWKYITKCVNKQSRDLPRTTNEVKKKWSDLCFSTKKLAEGNLSKGKKGEHYLSPLEKDVLDLIRLRHDSNLIENIVNGGHSVFSLNDDGFLKDIDETMLRNLTSCEEGTSDKTVTPEDPEPRVGSREATEDSRDNAEISQQFCDAIKLRTRKKPFKKINYSTRKRVNGRRVAAGKINSVDDGGICRNVESDTEMSDSNPGYKTTVQSTAEAGGSSSEKVHGVTDVLSVERERLEVEKRRLHVEEERLEVEKKRLKLEIYRWELEKARLGRKVAAEKNLEKKDRNSDKYASRCQEGNEAFRSAANNRGLIEVESEMGDVRTSDAQMMFVNHDVQQNSLLTYDTH